ncbi:MAG: RNA polymerase factor sigma-54 [Phycisphaerales bacterium]|jgi:RNA polymerase sigma-54 factor|nr:RNA polymerase factor sigma-54 [Phycisphaerales bacterium]MBT7170271.1 RNA polymerase factor sigma-54 [Phycisphaerales bacterium]
MAMQLAQSQHLRQSQEMRQTPKLIQQQEVLQLPLAAMEEYIDTALISNPVLEVDTPDAAHAAPADAPADDYAGETPLVVDNISGEGEFSRLDTMSNELGSDFAAEAAPYRRAKPDAGNDKIEALANTPDAPACLNDFLHEQWGLLDLAPQIARAGETIIDAVDPDGYLRTPLEELVSRDTPDDELHIALELVQTLDPPGVAARDARECLLLQLRRQAADGKDVATELEIVENFFLDLQHNHLPNIARRSGIALDEIKAAILRMAKLHMAPGKTIETAAARTITPDVLVTLAADGSPLVKLTDDRLPPLKINEEFRAQAKSRALDTESRGFLRKHILSAEWLLDAIAQRRRTLRNVAGAIFDIQREFLTEGPEALRPLQMDAIAERVGVDVSTVSRAVSGKYADTPRGTVALRMFFAGGTKSSDGEDMAFTAIKAKLRELIDNEPKAKPLSDQKLTDALLAAGIDIARRTVAKYREQMDIPPARQRKQF